MNHYCLQDLQFHLPSDLFRYLLYREFTNEPQLTSSIIRKLFSEMRNYFRMEVPNIQ